MRPNGIRRLWQDGKASVNSWLAIPSSFSAEAMARQGWDGVTIDMQHGLADYQTAVTMLQAIGATDATPMVRVPWLDPAIIMRMLDAGAYGVICPMISNRAQAEALVRACRYPPQGERSFGPVRVQLYAGADYGDHANEEVLVMAMIETAEAIEKLDEIASTPGLDALYVGPADLSIAMGYKPRLDTDEPKVVEMIRHILETAHANGIKAGIQTVSPDYALKMVELGFDLVTVGSDARYLIAAAQDTLARMRAGGPATGQRGGAY